METTQTSGPGWTLARVTYSMREDKFQKMVKREKSLMARPVKWLRKHKHLVTTNPRLPKSSCVFLILAQEFGYSTAIMFTNVKNQRSS